MNQPSSGNSESESGAGARPHEHEPDRHAASNTGLPADLPDELPPVEPPSAGFIMQLFLVPGLIVAAVIGVWALFGQISSSEQDWRQQVTELRSNNEQRRWRGANGLAQMLRADVELGKDGQQLRANRQIAEDLTGLLQELLDAPQQDQELINQQSFLVRTLGWLDSVDLVLPLLEQATEQRFDRLVRGDALRSISLIAGRLSEAGTPLDRPATIDCVIEASLDPDGGDNFIRQIATFTLGLLPGPDAAQRLKVLVEDADPDTRVNAAIALTRRGLPDGLPVFLAVLKAAPQPADPAPAAGDVDPDRLLEAMNRQQLNIVALGNSLKALRELGPRLTAEQRAAVIRLCEPIADSFPEIKIRVEAEQTLTALKSQ